MTCGPSVPGFRMKNQGSVLSRGGPTTHSQAIAEAVGIRNAAASAPTTSVTRRHRRGFPPPPIPSRYLEPVLPLVGGEEIEGEGGGGLERLRGVGGVGPAELRGLIAVGLRLALPAMGEEEHREPVVDVAAGVFGGVELGVGEAGEADQVGGVDEDASLLAQLADGGVAEARVLLRPACRQAPHAVGGPALAEDGAVPAREGD